MKKERRHTLHCSVLLPAGSAGDHKSHLRQKLLMRLFEDHVMELLAVMAQYTDAVSLGTGLMHCTLHESLAAASSMGAAW